MSLIYYKILAGILILLTSLIAVAYPIKVRNVPSHNHLLELGDALASGIFLGAALFHMLPDAITDFNNVLSQIHYPLAELICVMGFLLLLFFEKLSGKPSHHSHIAIPFIIAIIIILHSFVEGIALGINNTFTTAAIIFLAVIAHKGSESFMLGITLMRSKLAMSNITFLILIFVLMTPIGILIGTSANFLFDAYTATLITAFFNAFAAGTFLYMSTLHHINHHQQEHYYEGLVEFAALVLGIGIMAILAIAG